MREFFFGLGKKPRKYVPAKLCSLKVVFPILKKIYNKKILEARASELIWPDMAKVRPNMGQFWPKNGQF